MPRPVVSGQDLHRQLQTEGGFSVDPYTGQVPQSGTMVSTQGAEEQYPGTAYPSQIESYAQRRGPHMQATGAYMGGWQEDDTGFLDQSRRFQDRDQAMEYGRRNAQRAMYDLDQQQDVRVNYVPEMKFNQDSLFGQLSSNDRHNVNSANQEMVRRAQEQRLIQQDSTRNSPEMKSYLQSQGAARRQAQRASQLRLM